MSGPLLPFLYQTRTLQRLPRSCVARQLVRSFHGTTATRAPRPDPIPFDLPPELKSDRSIPKSSNEPQEGTITPSERRAFERIFDEIAARRPAPSPLDEYAFPEESSSLEPIAMPQRSGSSTLDQARRNDINIIVSNAAADAPSSMGGLNNTFSPSGLPSNPADRAKALKRFPMSLRKAAGFAFGVDDISEIQGQSLVDDKDGRDGSVSETPAPSDRGTEFDPKAALNAEHRAMRIEERIRVQAILAQSKTDIELWDVMEREIFSLVQRLGIDGKQTKPKTKQGGKKKKTAPSQAPSGELSIEVYGALYPSYLISALRLLDNHFAHTSPLALSVLPRVKQLGLSSYVLGISTPFYNTLMSIYWYRYGDMKAVLTMLEEMRQAGLYFDGMSLSIVRDLQEHFARSASGKAGTFLQGVATMPEYADAFNGRLRHWERQIERSIRERQQDLGY